jgi:putative hydrolase of HD superfamily
MRILVTAGPTREFMDPVRFISNRSSGKMGYAVAMAARDRGHEVVLVSGPVALTPPAGIRLIKVVSAADMLDAVSAQLESCDALVMAAAVADWRPVDVSDQKVKKLTAESELRLQPTADILLTLKPRKGKRVFVGFAAETTGVEAEARRKLSAKGLNMIVANDVSQPDAGFDVETNRVVFITPDASPVTLPLMSKRDVAERIVEWVEKANPLIPAPGTGAQDGGLNATGAERLSQQWNFIREIDKLKLVLRRTLLMDGSRYENDAEHSWHLAVMAVLLREHANEPALDLVRVIKMVLVHDIVEIDAGDTYCYDEKGNLGKLEREKVAADRLFGILPGDQQRELMELWQEFEARATPEAKFAAALDRVQPLMHNYGTGGVVWKSHGVTYDKVLERNRHVEEGSRVLWEFSESMIRDAVKRGYLDE